MLIKSVALLSYVAYAASWNVTHTYKRPQGVWSHDIKTIICGSQNPNRPVPLMVFTHGFGLYAEDYGYMCTEMPARGYIVALVDSYAGYVPYEGGLDYDMQYLAGELHRESVTNQSSPIFGLLSETTIFSGHSLGATVSFKAAADTKGPTGKGSPQALATMAPSKQGILDDAAQLKIPSLQLVGSKDCAASNGLAASALPIYDALSHSDCKVLVVLVNGNHCNFTSPVKGKCPYDKCGTLTKEVQQGTAVELFHRFFQLISKTISFDQFALTLSRGVDQGQLMYRYHFNGSDMTSSNFVNHSCPC